VFGRLNRPLVAAAVAGAAVTAMLAGPSAALACNGGTSAVNVYTECVKTGGGGKPTGGAAGHSSAGAKGPASTSVPAKGPVAKALKHAGADKSILSNLVAGDGLRRTLQSSRGEGPTTAPSAIGSAFDLGSGPTVLLIALAGTAVLLLGGTGMRLWRARHRA
jgi:hypothetical protein